MSGINEDLGQFPNNTLPGQTQPYLGPNGLLIPKPRLRNVPVARDAELPKNDPNQQITDCRTIEGWIDTIDRLLHAAWGDQVDGAPWQFTHDFALIPQDPQDMHGLIIVWSLISMIPAKVGSHTEIKPRVREVQYSRGTAMNTSQGARVAPFPISTGSTWIWAQSMDCVVKFCVYADTYARKNAFLMKFMDFMQTYTGLFVQTGLQHLLFRGLLEENLYDPPRTTPIPNQAILYDVRIERQTKADWAVIEQVLITAGVIDPLTNTLGDTQLTAVEEGLPESPILPSSNNPAYPEPDPIVDWTNQNQPTEFP